MIIRNVSINGFWGKYSLNWKLDSSVNVISGINGSGKSTLLRALAEVLKADFVDDVICRRFRSMKVELTHGYSVGLEVFEDTLGNLKKQATSKTVISKIVNNIEQNNDIKDRDDVKTVVNAQALQILKGEVNVSRESFGKEISSEFISTFDFAPRRPLNPAKALEYVMNPNFSELDRHLDIVVEKYRSYLINLSSRMARMMEEKGNDYQSVKQLFQEKNRFLDIFDALLESSGKRINRDLGDMEFFFKDDDVSHPYSDLSAGEKQLMLIMLSVFMQEGREAIIIMDEPEISLHIDWQSKLISTIKELNPNCQIIISTHSPALIIDGWQNAVVNIEDLISPV